MGYQAHVEAAIARTGLIRPECAGQLARLLQENEGQHPRQIGRLFRQLEPQVSVEQKRAIGLRSNAAMSEAALAALTDKGLAAPIEAFENTLLDATFRFFRERSVRDARAAGYDTFRIDNGFPAECRGCARLNGADVTGSVLKDLPPSDCERQACALGLTLHIDFLAGLERSRPRGPLGFLARLFGRR